MKLTDLYEFNNPDGIKNPLPNVIGLNDPLFGEAYDALDDVIYDTLDQQIPKKQWDEMTVRQRADTTLQIRKSLSTQTTLPIASLIGTEPMLDPKHLEALKRGNPKGSAFVFKYKGKYFIGDGNHRVASDFQSGKKDINVTLLDVDASSKGHVITNS